MSVDELLAALELRLDVAVFVDRRGAAALGTLSFMQSCTPIVGHALHEDLADLGVEQRVEARALGCTRYVFTPSAANRQAYSEPMTPPPTTTIDLGSVFMSRTVVESKTLASLNGIVFGPRRDGAGGDEDELGGEPFSWPSGPLTTTVCASASLASPWMRSTSCHSMFLRGPLLLALLHEVFAGHEVLEVDVGLEVDLHALAELARAEAGEEQGRFAERLAGERAPVDARAAELLVVLDEAGLVVEVRGLRRRLLAGGPAADDDQLVVIIRHDIPHR